MSSATLSPIFENGSGELFAIRREEALAVWGDQAGTAGQQDQENIKGRSGMAEYLNSEECSANRPDEGVNSIPGRIYPWDFVREEFEKIENTRDGDDPGMAEDFERLIIRRQRRSSAG